MARRGLGGTLPVMRTWRNLLAAAALLALLYGLYPRTSEGRRAGVTEVTIWFNGPIEGRLIEVLDAFERQFPQYRAILGSSAVRTGLEGEGNPQRLMCGIAGGVPPEVVEYDRFAICQWAARGAFKDLTPLIERDARDLQRAREKLARLREDGRPHEVAKAQTEIARHDAYDVRESDYFEAPWRECKYEGGVYGVPNFMDDRVLYYNADMLIQAGFVNEDAAPKPPDSWEQVLLKRLDVTDAAIMPRADGEFRIRCESADLAAAGVRPGDTVAHLSKRDEVTRCIVKRVDGAHELTVRSAYRNRRLALPAGRGEHIKVFDADGYALRLTRWDDEGRIKTVGFEPQQGNAWLYLYGWANGGQFLSPDGRTCTLNDPRIVESLQWTTDIYDALGGSSEVNAFKKSFQTAGQDPFLLGQVAMFINGDWFMRDVARYKRDMRFGTHPAPVPQRMIDAGKRYCTWVAGMAYCIPSTCPPEKLEAAWTLVKYLSSVEGGQVQNEHDAQRERGQGRLYMPRMMASRRLQAEQLRRYIRIPEMPQPLQAAMDTHLQMLSHGFHRPVSPEGQQLWNGQADAQDLAWSHAMSPRQALDYETRRVQRALDKFYSRPAHARPVHWGTMLALYALLLLATAVVVYVRHRGKHAVRGFYRREWYAGILFALPWMVGFIVLSGGPMVFSAVMSLTEYDVINPARWVGLENYHEMFTVDWGGPGADGKETVPTGVRRTLLNTVYMAIGLPLGMIVGLGLALLLDARVGGMRFYRTMFFLPAIMPVVAASILWIWVFNAHNGMLNWLLHLFGIDRLLEWANAAFGWTAIRPPISWLTNKHTSKLALILMGLWGSGASMIIWLAGLKGIPSHLYSAAALDGAGPVRRFFRVTLPMLSPYVLFNLIIGLIGTLQIFTQAYIMTPNGYPERSTYFYVYKLFDECFSYFRLGYGAAMAWVLFAIVVVLTAINMKLSRRWVFYAGE